MFAMFATAVPLSGLIGAPLSGWLMTAFNGAHGYAGWQWLFFIEGLPSIAVGILVIFCLSDRLSHAGWLTQAQKTLLQSRIDAETDGHVAHSVREVFLQPRMWLLTGIYFCLIAGFYTVGFWLPTLVRQAGVTDLLQIGLLTAILIAPTRGADVALGKQLATLDVLSDGRFTAGVAVGGRPDDYAVSDLDFERRGRWFDEALEAWRAAGTRSANEVGAWQGRVNGLDAARRTEFERRIKGDLPSGLAAALDAYKQKLAADKPKVATRKSSQMALDVINAVMPETVGGSADLTGSNLTNTPQTLPFTDQDRFGRYMRYGIREHGMSAIMNGMALHKGLVPYGGTFLVFTDYARPAIRLSAIMEQRVIYVMTHDSIGLGEDGPTHQPVEHLAALRAIPHLQVLRPADAVETLECWQIALQSKNRPSILALSRQNLPPLRLDYVKENLSAKGAYKIAGDDTADAVIFATGSEVAIAVDALPLLKEKGISGKVVSVPCLELFDAQDDAYKAKLIGKPKARVAVEAGIGLSWQKLLGEKGHFVGMHSFGASGPAEKLYEYFGITPEGVVEAVTRQL